MKKVYIVTGGTSGIGLSIVKMLSDNHNNLVVSLSRDINKINQAKNITHDSKGKVRFIQCDVSNVDHLKNTFKEIRKDSDKIDGLVNAAGVIKVGGLEELNITDWDKNINTNLSSMFYVTKIFLPMLKLNKNGGSIVNISSISSKISGASISYSASKAGVDMLTKVLARELAKYKIRVNCVNPGMVKTGFQVHNNIMDENQYINFLSKIKETYPLGLGKSEDIAHAVLFLLSEKSAWMTGSVMIVDGGRMVNS